MDMEIGRSRLTATSNENILDHAHVASINFWGSKIVCSSRIKWREKEEGTEEGCK